MASVVGLSPIVVAVPQIVGFTTPEGAGSVRRSVSVFVDRRGLSSVDAAGIRSAGGLRHASVKRFVASSQSHVGLRQQGPAKHHFGETLPSRKKILSTPGCEARDGGKELERRDGGLKVRAGGATSAPAAPKPKVSGQVRPSPAEQARTIVDISNEGTLSTLSENDSWPTATAVRFALDAQGNPVFRFPSSALHTRNLALDNRASLHVQLEQPGRQKPQCTLRGRIQKADEPDLHSKLEIAWERRFGVERAQDDAYFVMTVEQALQSQDMGEEEVWMSGEDYSSAVADPLREFAVKIVDDMNQKHWEDVRRFTNVYAGLKAEVEESSMTWVDRLGFDLRVLTKNREMLEIRIPFVREVTDERDARSSLTIMAQIAWELERSYNPPDVAFVGSFSVSS